MKLFDREYSAPIRLEKGCDSAILAAAENLRRDLLTLSGKKEGFLLSEEGEGGILVQTIPSEEIEAYSVKVEGETVTVTGSDVLGTVYGIYAVSTRLLGVSPTHLFTDLFPEIREEMVLSEESFSSPHRPVRFRGWFINDEDLLNELEDSGFVRDLDYNYYHCVMAESVMEKVIETALRLEYNLIIPATLLDIDRPGEEKLVETACRLGMYVSQHHIEPMGVSHFTAEKYLERQGRQENVSFISNRPLMEEMWEYYAGKWAKYGDRVVWQLGLRGKKDEAVWKNDPSAPMTMEGRGAIISDAINTQHKILTKVLGHQNFHSTTTLWNEGSLLYGQGHLTLPKGTIPILADFGIDQMFGEDMFSTRHEEGRHYGVYYHTSFWALGPHLCEGCRPEKMSYSYRIAAEKDNLYYSMLNVSNVRTMHFSISMNARILQDPAKSDGRKEMESFDRKIFGEKAKEASALRCRYYDSFADFGSELSGAFAEKWFFFYHKYPTLPFIRNAATDGQLTWLGKYALLGKLHCDIAYSTKERLPALLESEKKLADLVQDMAAFKAGLKGQEKGYFERFLEYQTLHLLHMTRWSMACLDLVDPALPLEERKAAGEKAICELEATLLERKVLEEGKWARWHKGDEKMNIPLRLAETKNYLAKL